MKSQQTAKFIIHGLNPLGGEIEVYGSKNTAIKIIAASVLIPGQVILNNVPDILDVQKMISILEKMGGIFSRQDHQLTLDLTDLRPIDPDPDLVRQMRASIVLVGPLLARFGKVSIPHPGGCLIGPRPIDRHLKAFRDLGAEIIENQHNCQFKFSQSPQAKKVIFNKISVTASENVIIFAAFQKQKTIIENAAIEPEVIDLIEFLKLAGAKIQVLGRRIEILGTQQLKPLNYKIIPDRIEAATFAIMAAASRGNLNIKHLNPDHLTSLLSKFQAMGIKFEKGKDFLYIKNSPKILATNIFTAEYPGFPTDIQSPMGLLLTQAEGKSRLKENIFENRLGYLLELQKMGAKIKIINSKEAIIFGPTPLHGAKINSLDLRAGATLIIGGLIAKGKTEILQAENIDRGYEKIEERLKKIGARIERVLI